MNAAQLISGLRYRFEHKGPITTLSMAMSYALRYIYYRLKYGTSAPRPAEIIEVKPEHIEFLITPSELRGHFGEVPRYRVLGGEWDQLKSRFDSHLVHQSFVEHFSKGVPWEETTYHAYLQDHPTRETTELSQYEDLYENIKHNGYNKSYPIEVHIGRDGELIRYDGSHRLSIAKILDLDRISAKVLIRHSQYQTDPTVSIPTIKREETAT